MTASLPIDRRGFLRQTANAAPFVAGLAVVAMPVTTARSAIEDMFRKWLEVRETGASNYDRYRDLQERITSARPASARDLAMQIVAETDNGESDWRPEFFERLCMLAREGRS